MYKVLTTKGVKVRYNMKYKTKSHRGATKRLWINGSGNVFKKLSGHQQKLNAKSGRSLNGYRVSLKVDSSRTIKARMLLGH